MPNDNNQHSGDLRLRESLGIRAREAREYAKLFHQEEGGGAPLSGKDSPPVGKPFLPAFGQRDKRKKLSISAQYKNRMELDSFLALPEFGIKSFWQMFWSRFSFFKAPPDKVSKFFVQKRLLEVYDALEQFVTKVRLIFPRNEQFAGLKQHSQFAYNVFNTIRRWNLSRISACIGHLQYRANNVYISDLKEFLTLVYRPIFILEAFDPAQHIPFIINKLFYVTLANNPDSISSVNREVLTKELIMHCRRVLSDVRYYLYPVLMKLIAGKYCPYETFFVEYRAELFEFLTLKEEQRIIPPGIVEDDNSESEEEIKNKNEQDNNNYVQDNIEDKAEIETKAIELLPIEDLMKRGLAFLSLLFPESSWEAPWNFPDYYSYFRQVYQFRKGFEYLDRENPVMQILVLSHILQDIFFGWTYIELAENSGSANLLTLTTQWYENVDNALNGDYLKLLGEYFSYFSTAAQFRKKEYGDKIYYELGFVTKKNLLPELRYNFPNNINFIIKNRVPLFSTIGTIYRELDAIQAAREIGAVRNPNAKFIFDIPNPVSRRLFSLFDKDACTNSLLIRVTHEIAAVLNYLVNESESWAYSTNPKKVFRSSDEAGIVPLVWRDPEDPVNPDNIFRYSIEALRQKAALHFGTAVKTN